MEDVRYDEISFSFYTWGAVPKKSTLGKLTYSRHFQRVVIIATKSENVLIHFKSDLFVAVAIFTKDNATANRTARAQENNRLGMGRELGRVARKSDLAKNNRTCGMWKHMFSNFVCSLVLWGISRLFFALLKSDWEHKHAWLMNLVRWLNHLARWMECSILNRF